VWLDGQWTWGGKTWNWLPGAWVTPPKGGYFTPWTAARRADGRLFFTPATWRTRDGHALDFGPGRDRCTAPLAPEEVAKTP
jgi:hypothetical protein